MLKSQVFAREFVGGMSYQYGLEEVMLLLAAATKNWIKNMADINFLNVMTYIASHRRQGRRKVKNEIGRRRCMENSRRHGRDATNEKEESA